MRVQQSEAMTAATAREVRDGLRAIAAGIGELKAQRWYVVRVKGKHERWAAQNLKANKHQVYLPMWRRAAKVGFVQRKGQVRGRIEHDAVSSSPLFPGYLFVRVEDEGEWASILTTMGVQSVVGVRERFTCVRAGEVLKLQLAEKLGLMAMASAEAIHERLAGVEPGDPVKLLMVGEEMQAIFGTNVDEERCMVLLSICGRDSRIYVPKALVSR
jgi:transcriptional antiterminator RfaH